MTGQFEWVDPKPKPPPPRLYTEFAYEQANLSAQLPGSPASRGIRSRVPGTSRHLEHLQHVRRAVDMINGDPRLASGWDMP